jgi:hypothetical protein
MPVTVLNPTIDLDLRRQEKYIVPTGNQTQDHPARCLVISRYFAERKYRMTEYIRHFIIRSSRQ